MSENYKVDDDGVFLKRGDVVQLNSGGPNMTIISSEKYKYTTVECIWFNGGVVEKYAFHADTLINVLEKQPKILGGGKRLGDCDPKDLDNVPEFDTIQHP